MTAFCCCSASGRSRCSGRSRTASPANTTQLATKSVLDGFAAIALLPAGLGGGWAWRPSPCWSSRAGSPWAQALFDEILTGETPTRSPARAGS